MFEKWFVHQYDLAITETPYAAKLLDLAQREAADLFVLLLNNMFYSDISHLMEKNRVECGLAVIAQLNQTYHKPVIAMTGWPPSEDTWTEDNTRQAGASFLFFLPLEGEFFRNAVKQCLGEAEPARPN